MEVQSQRRGRMLPIAAMLVGNMIYGAGYMFERMALLAEGSTPLLMLSSRFLVSAVVLLLMALIGRMRFTLHGRSLRPLLLLMLAEPVFYVFETYGIHYTNATFAGIASSVVPVFSVLLAAIFLREYPRWYQLLFCVLPVAGVALMAVSGQELGVVTPIGVVFLAMSCLTSAAYKTANRSASKAFSPFERSLAIVTAGAVTFTAAALVSVRFDLRAYFRPWSQTQFVLPVLELGVMSSIVASMLINFAAGRVSVMRMSVFGAVMTVFSAVCGVLFLNEPMPPLAVFGAVLAILGVWLVNLPPREKKAKKTKITKDLQPQAFFRWFEAISRIPHGSGKEQKLAAWLADFAAARAIPCETDAAGNVFMTLPASPGYEGEPPVLLQAHMDMIWVKDPDSDFDFETEPIRLVIDGDHLTADGTTLGSDNAVGMATMLALADDPAIKHPPLELLFTVQEEVGLIGAREFDQSRLHARRMLNMDCGYTDILCVASSGKISGKVEAQLDTALCGDATAIAVTGGFAAHFAHIAEAEHACAYSIVGALLRDLPCRLISLSSPADNVLAALTAVVSGADRAELTRRMDALQRQFSATEPSLSMTLADAPDGEAVGAADTQRIAAMLCAVRGGNYSPTADRITASGALRALSLRNGELTAAAMTRSIYDAEMEHAFGGWQTALRELGFALCEVDRYSGWPEREISPFRGKFERAHKRLLGTDVTYERVMGGVEVGVLVGAIPEMDAVGYAPSAHGAHTTAEYLEISQVQPFWDVLLAVLAEKEGETE